MSVQHLRTEYNFGVLNEANVGDDPLVLFQNWLDAALQAKVPEPNAMSVSTVNSDGQPSSRIVLLRHVDDHGLQFFTNYQSRKGTDIATSQHVALLFFWPQLERQIRVSGTAHKVSAEVSDAYFSSRPYESQLGAHVSAQSSVIDDADQLTQQLEAMKEQFPDHVPRPDHWGGYNVWPESFEFWQGRPSRLHDRFLFERTDDRWKRSRLSP